MWPGGADDDMFCRGLTHQVRLDEARDRAGEVLEVCVLHGPEVEQEPVVLDPADDRRTLMPEALVQGVGGKVRVAEGQDRRGKLGERQRATPHLARILTDPSAQRLSHLRRDSPVASPGAAGHQ